MKMEDTYQMASIRTIDIRDPEEKIITVEIENKSRNPKKINRKCAGGCGGQGKWRFATRNFLCPECRKLPQHKLITVSTAMKKYDLTFAQLQEASKRKSLQRFTNHVYRGPPLYFEKEIQRVANAYHRNAAPQ